MPLIAEFTTLTELFDALTARFRSADRPMLMSKSDGAYRGFSFGEVRAAVDELAIGFHRLGLKQGDAVGIIAENRPEWAMCDLALMRLGVVTVPMYTTLTPKQVSFILQDAGASAVIVSNQLQLRKVRQAAESVPSVRDIVMMNPPPAGDSCRTVSDLRAEGQSHPEDAPSVNRAANAVQPDDLLTIIYTSGTTGNPKGVMLSHRNIVSNIYSVIPFFQVSSDDLFLSYLPLSHSFERIVYYVALATGATIAYAESIETIRDNLMEVKPTIVTTVPRLFERMYNRIMKQVEGGAPLEKRIFQWALAAGYAYADARRRKQSAPIAGLQFALADRLVFRKIRARTGGRLRFFVSGGAALSPDLGRFFEAAGIQIIEGYGMTESSPVISINRVDDYKFGSVGKAIQDVDVMIAPDGEILARGENVMVGYWNNPDDTRQIIDGDDWLHTGDIGHIDGDGFIFITDRKKHIFVNSGGKNIAPQHVEGLFAKSACIDQFVLIGEKRSYCTALIVPDYEVVRDVVGARQHDSQRFAKLSNEELCVDPDVRAFFEEEINRTQVDLANYERVRKFTLLPAPLTIEGGELTPTMKVKRRVVEERFSGLINSMYQQG